MREITIACPEAHIYEGNQFSRCIGLGPDDDKTFGPVLYQDLQGNRYSVAAGLVPSTFEQSATSPLVEPEWGCDLGAAMAAQAMIRTLDQIPGELLATPETIAAMFGPDPAACIADLGLTLIEVEL